MKAAADATNDVPTALTMLAFALIFVLGVGVCILVQEVRRIRHQRALATWERLHLMDAIIDGRRTLVVRPNAPAKPVRKTGLPFSPYNRRSA